MDFEKLITTIITTSSHLQQSAVKAVNTHITLRNWLIGFYIIEFEQNGEDRAKYGTKLLLHIANELASKNLKNVNERELRNFRTFYKTYAFFSKHLATLPIYSLIASTLNYSLIRGSVTPESENVIRQSATPELQNIDNLKDVNYF